MIGKTRKRRWGEGRVYQPRPGGAWYIDYRRNGERFQQRVGLDKAEAERQLLRSRALEVLRQTGGASFASNNVALQTVADAWLQDVAIRCKPKTAWFYTHCIGEILARLPVRSVSQLTVAVLSNYATARINPASKKDLLCARTVNMHTSALKTMLTWAASARLIESNPIASVKPIKNHVKRFRRALDAAEVARLLEKSPPCYRRIWMFLLGTGFRRSEVQGLKWDDIDLDRAEVHLGAEASKNNTASITPLPTSVADMLRELKATSGHDTEYVFVNREGRPWRNHLLQRFRSCLKAAGIIQTGVDLHSLRRTYITHLIRAGVDVKTVQVLARHKRIAMTLDTYAQSFPEDQRQAVERLPVLGEQTGSGLALRTAQAVGA